MTSPRDVIRFKIAQTSDKIRKIKDLYPTVWEGKAEMNINPKCKEWSDYISLKAQASFWLTAANIDRWLPNPSKATKLALLRLPESAGPLVLRNHAPKKQAKKLAIRALAKLKKIIKNLKTPSPYAYEKAKWDKLFAEASAWAAKEEVERQARKAAKAPEKAPVAV